VGVALLLFPPISAAGETVAAPIQPDVVRSVIGRPDAGAFQCPPPVAPVTDMGGFSTPYDVKDPTQSKVDPKRAALGAERYAALMKFGGQLSGLADRYMTSNPPDQAIARCAVADLRAWADAGALLANVDANDALGRHEAVMLQAWNLAGYTSAFAKLGKTADLSEADRSAIFVWFGKLADSVEQEYSGNNQWTRAGNNLFYWAAFSVGMAGAVLNERSRVDFALQALDRGLGDIASDGSLPKEIARGGRAMMYQNFASLPLAGLVALADANGRKLPTEEEAALARLVRFNLSQVCDPALASQLAGVKQPKTADRTNLAWADVILPHIATTDPQLAGALDTLVAGVRPLSHVYFGGNVSAAYNPRALASGRGPAPAKGAPGAPC
jgi:poly(beta-D-mannuronate) lyase